MRAESVAGRSWATRVNAQARADLRVVSLFGGEVTVGAVVARTQASAKTGEESFSGTSVTSLTVLGQSIEPAPDLRVPLADWGHLTLLQERTAGESTHRGWVTAVDVALDADHAGLPVGTRILIGYAEASATAPQPTVAKPVVTEPAKPRAVAAADHRRSRPCVPRAGAASGFPPTWRDPEPPARHRSSRSLPR